MMDNEPVELSFFSDAVVRRWYLVVGLALIGGLIGLQLRPEVGETVYEAEAKLLIRPVTDAIFESNLRVDQIINGDTEAQLAGSELVARGALEILGAETPRNLGVDEIKSGLVVKVSQASQIVTIRFQHRDPDIAGAVADAVANSYLLNRSQPATEEKDRQANQLASQISQLTRDLTAANITIAAAETGVRSRDSLEGRIARLEEVVAIAELRGDESEAIGDPIGRLKTELVALEPPVDPTELAAANTTVELITGQISDIRDELIKLLTLEIDGGSPIQRAGVGEAIIPASQMIEPAIGALVGLMLGVMAAVAVERSVSARSTRNRTFTDSLGSAPGHRILSDVAPLPSFSNGQAIPQSGEPVRVQAPDPTTWGIDDEPPAVESPVASAPVDPILTQAAQPKSAAPDSPAPEPPAKSAPLPAPLSEQMAQNETVQSGPPNTVAALADVPKIPRSAREPVVVTAPESEPAIALSRVAAIITNETIGIRTPSVLITSPGAHEGRTTVAANVAAALRQSGLKVLLVTDSNGRVIAPGVHILPPGMHLGPDSQFPDNDRLPELLDEARDLVDIVIIDGPPALVESEAARIAAFMDVAVIVAIAGRTKSADVAATKQQLEDSGARVVGLVTTARPSWLVRRIGDRTVAGDEEVPFGTSETDSKTTI